VSVAASVANHAADQKWSLGVLANGAIPGSDQPIRVPPGRSPDQLVRVLEALAAVSEFATGSIELILERESRRLPVAATLLLVTAVLTDEIVASLLRLKEAGRRVAVILLSAEPPPQEDLGLRIYHVPPDRPLFQPLDSQLSATEAALRAVPEPDGGRPYAAGP
jgi:uncharacterized protein (DUF58 family)